MNITSLFISAAQQYPDKIAIIEKSGSITYGQLEKEVKATATYFRKKGIAKGDRVLVFVPMSIDLYRTVLALFYIGATAVFLDEWVSKKRLELCCQLANCKGFIGVPKARIFSLFSKELRRIPVKLKLKKQGKFGIPMAETNPNLSALITFTTGSTGTPKAADRTHGFLKAQFEALLDEIDPQVNDIDMPVLPIVLFVNLGVGCTSVIADFKMTKPEKMKPESIAGQIKDNQVNRITASPFFIKRLSEFAINNNIKFPGVKKIFTGGAPVFPDEAQLYDQAFPSSQNTIVYGSTEAEPISSIRTIELVKKSEMLYKGLPVGQPYHKTGLKLIKITNDSLPNLTHESLETLTLPEGTIGEIIVSGPHVLKQYYNNEEAFKTNKIVVGDTIWHRTGDSGYIENGELFLTGRCKQLITVDGHYLSPFIIENQLQSITGIDCGTLIESNQQLILIVETQLQSNQLTSQLNNIPHDLLKTVDQIPKDPRHNSKIDYEALKTMT